MGRSPKPLAQRLWAKVAVAGPNECWEWQGYRNAQGYGSIFDGDGGTLLVHRVTYMVARGPIPDDMCVCHHCDNPPCCNPAHLWLGDRIANNIDRDVKGRGHDRRGALNPSAKLTAEQVAAIRNEYVPYHVSVAKLAVKYAMSEPQVYRIVTGNAW